MSSGEWEVVNAAKAAKPSGPTVSVSTSAGGGYTVTVKVEVQAGSPSPAGPSTTTTITTTAPTAAASVQKVLAGHSEQEVKKEKKVEPVVCLPAQATTMFQLPPREVEVNRPMSVPDSLVTYLVTMNPHQPGSVGVWQSPSCGAG